ncbi:GNAT family N-acetyltransferase [Planotetraspora thailandica]|uniref:GNAT family N-acetyltransferase n=1 Tax=Planotetraspora thailandica TaxID=487172 RepID=UPI00194E6970|nr:GNAT family N-acetyltransferase [Planotetraspora thailandica]
MKSETSIEDWRHVHNVIVPPAALTLDEVRERVRRNRLEVAYLGDVVVGCTTVRPPEGDADTVTLIVRVLPEHRRRGFGTALFSRALKQAWTLGAGRIETVIWGSNLDGLHFARTNGFVEESSYLPPGEQVPFLTWRLA